MRQTFFPLEKMKSNYSGQYLVTVKVLNSYDGEHTVAEKRIWTEEELRILEEWYPVEGIRVEERLPGRNRSMITQRARRLGVSAPVDDWSESELNILKEWYLTEGSEVAERLPGKSRHAVRAQAQRLGLTNKARWSEEENEIVRTYYPLEGPRTAERLNGRTRESVRIHAQKLGIRCE